MVARRSGEGMRMGAEQASAAILATVSVSAARRHPADLPTAMAAYVTRALSRDPSGDAAARAAE
jgi:hypothetical protein